ncbi:MAG: undecaprenyldiphospho-muramoylpentapeptide beta-N-acetylglucosaminyltransferase [Oscillospiraceae bacterium]|nr:undecaprenyldiphospho-muramoylpentapeptide beta-N-acetylglucosaminyltransferase [Oscillospiraceae bacterium]
MRVVFACGGTGGHINPALAMAGIISARCPQTEFLFVGTPGGMEATLVPQAGYPISFVKVAGFQRSFRPENIVHNMKAVSYLMTAGSHAKKILKEFRPDLAIGTGGYASGPVIRAAQQLSIPTVIHEQNAYPGVTNKLLAPKAKAIMLTFEAARERFPRQVPMVLTGLPVRSTLLRRKKEQARQHLGFSEGMTILSFGGSQGAKCLNDLMPEVIEWHRKAGMKINHIHAYGKHGRDEFPAAMAQKGIPMEDGRLRVTEYIHDMDLCLAAADLVISRSGASTLSELEMVGRASILIPYPNAAENHQLHNANELGTAGAAIVIEQKQLSAEVLKEKIESLYHAPEKLAAMGQRAGALAIRDTDERIWQVLKPLLP